MITILIVLLLFPFLLVIGFGTLSIGRAWKKDPECPPWLIFVCTVIVAVLYITDPVFNVTWAAVIFRRDWFREFTFSSRLNYYFEHPEKCTNVRSRNLWARLLDMGIADHIDTRGQDVSPRA